VAENIEVAAPAERANKEGLERNYDDTYEAPTKTTGRFGCVWFVSGTSSSHRQDERVFIKKD